MTDMAAVEELSHAAVAAFGRIDVWINSAAVLLFGAFEEIPPAAFRQVIETNLLGYVNGARAALKQFRLQGGRGTLINVASVLGAVPEPYVSAYVASKFAIRGFSGCLRQEVRDTPGIRVCTVSPAALDTPVYRNAGNYRRQEARSIVPVYDPYRVARVICNLSQRPRREVVVSAFGWFVMFGARLSPALTERVLERLGPKLQFKSESEPATEGNLFHSTSNRYSVHGGWRSYWVNRVFRNGNN
jgi:NAD(P)-dependent dehydrogenase (short-subunit alcohol dehydrogenase family)